MKPNRRKKSALLRPLGLVVESRYSVIFSLSTRAWSELGSLTSDSFWIFLVASLGQKLHRETALLRVFLIEHAPQQMTRRYGHAPRGQRVSDHVPRDPGVNVTLIGALSPRGLKALMTIPRTTASLDLWI